jgi:acyl-CoA thioester hydrolase
MDVMRTSRTRNLKSADLRPKRPIPTEGEIRVRVRYCECDPMNVAHHGTFVAWLEMARTELMRTSGIAYADLEQAGVFLVVTKLELAYKAPARYDDMIVVVVRVTGGGRARINHEYEVWLDTEDGRGKRTLLVTASSTLGCVGSDGKPRPLPEWLTPDAHVDQMASG